MVSGVVDREVFGAFPKYERLIGPAGLAEGAPQPALSNFGRGFARRARQDRGFALCGEKVSWVAVVVEGDGCGHDPIAVWRGSVEPGAGHFGDESVTAKLHDEARDALAAAVGVLLVGWGLG